MNTAKLVTLASGIQIIIYSESEDTFQEAMQRIRNALGVIEESAVITDEQWENLIEERYGMPEIKELFNLTDLEYVYLFGAIWDDNAETFMEDMVKRIMTVVNSGVPQDNWFSNSREPSTESENGVH